MRRKAAPVAHRKRRASHGASGTRALARDCAMASRRREKNETASAMPSRWAPPPVQFRRFRAPYRDLIALRRHPGLVREQGRQETETDETLMPAAHVPPDGRAKAQDGANEEGGPCVGDLRPVVADGRAHAFARQLPAGLSRQRDVLSGGARPVVRQSVKERRLGEAGIQQAEERPARQPGGGSTRRQTRPKRSAHPGDRAVSSPAQGTQPRRCGPYAGPCGCSEPRGRRAARDSGRPRGKAVYKEALTFLAIS